ncbi:MAG TPA: hypothetical protein VGG61_04560 [Gemmataceae bacterium]|jgi:hypothetical protein
MAKRKSTDQGTMTRLPIPERLEPKVTTRALRESVRVYFYSLYNAASSSFRDLLVSVGNEDAITGNRTFDRHNATIMIKEAAKKADDHMVKNALDGAVYKCIVDFMRENNLGLKLRRREYERLTHQQTPAE